MIWRGRPQSGVLTLDCTRVLSGSRTHPECWTFLQNSAEEHPSVTADEHADLLATLGLERWSTRFFRSLSSPIFFGSG